VARVIHYLYLGDYHTGDDGCTSDSHSVSPRIYLRSPSITRRDKSINSWPEPCVNDERAEQRYDKLLTVHLDVYRCASYLGIEPLRKYAAWLFVDLLSEPVSKKCFIDAVKMVYENIATEDAMLRTATTEVCAFNYLIISESPDLTSVMKQHEPAAWGVACKVATAYQMRYNSKIRALTLSAARQSTYACPGCNEDYEAAYIDVHNNSSALTVCMVCDRDDCEEVEIFSA
jgi:hypothetical protein